ncbi:MAG: T9SS type A sorting domain-containing protein, partial [Bacteroidota bacterium]
ESIADKITVDIYGIYGEKVLTTILNTERKHEFSLSDGPSGVYFIRVVTSDKTETLKIIKQ